MASGDSDIKLVHGQVKVEAWDLCLDSPDRRTEHTNPHRRALVHHQDSLVMNWGEDYPAGVNLNGVSKILGYLAKTGIFRALTVEAASIRLFAPNGGAVVIEGGFLHLKRNPADQKPVEVTGTAKFKEGVTFEGPAVFTGSTKVVRVSPAQGAVGPIMMEYDVFDMINSLQKRVTDLEAKLASIKV